MKKAAEIQNSAELTTEETSRLSIIRRRASNAAEGFARDRKDLAGESKNGRLLYGKPYSERIE